MNNINFFTEIEINPDYKHFVQQIVQQERVFTLQDNDDNYAECPSEIHRDDLGDEITVYCFWQSEQTALACCNQEWQDYQVIELDLEEFIDQILLDMDEYKYLVGIEFDKQLFGSEIEPMALLNDILIEIEQQKKKHLFVCFDKLKTHQQKWQQKIQATYIVH